MSISETKCVYYIYLYRSLRICFLLMIIDLPFERIQHLFISKCLFPIVYLVNQGQGTVAGPSTVLQV